MHIGIGKIDRESGIVVLNDRAQQQRPFALEPKSIPRQELRPKVGDGMKG